MTIFPIKSLVGLEVGESAITTGGALANDREFSLIDAQGRLMRAKNTPRLHDIRAGFDLVARTVSLRSGSAEKASVFSLDHDRADLEGWFSDVLGVQTMLLQDTRTGLPDDANVYGPTVVSTATLEMVASWFPGIAVEEMRRRFRANLEIVADAAFAEDILAGRAENVTDFSIGEVRLEGVSLCDRCEIPARDSRTGTQDNNFAREFSRRRRETLPNWVPRDRFDHYYYLSVRTMIRPAEADKRLRVGDPCRFLGTRLLSVPTRRFERLRNRVEALLQGGENPH